MDSRADASRFEKRRICAWCGEPTLTDPRARFCGQKCRQSAHRLRKRGAQRVVAAATDPRRAAYADPPYPGLSHYYRDQPTYAGEVDHRALIASLAAFDGWALSTSSAALREVLPLCPPEVRVCAWTKPNPAPPGTYGLHSRWEALLVLPVRRMRPGFPDWLHAAPARLGGETLIGRKPIGFCSFLFRALGLLPGDTLADLFPGTGIVGRAWAEASRSDRTTTEARSDWLPGLAAVVPAPGDTSSPTAAGDMSRRSLDDVSVRLALLDGLKPAT